MSKRTKYSREDSLGKEGRSRSSGRSAEFNPDYSAVIKDLRRIGFLAGSFIFILVVLSFFLR
jgi:hypothetical protein